MRREARAEIDAMTVAMTQGVLNAFNADARKKWERRRARRADATGPRTQTKAQFLATLGRLAANPQLAANFKVN